MWFSVVILSTTIRIITVVNKFLTTVMTRIVVDKITTLNHIRFGFLLQYERLRTWFFFQSASWKRHCVTHWREQRCLDTYRQLQIRQSDSEISSNCGKNSIFPLQAIRTLTLVSHVMLVAFGTLPLERVVVSWTFNYNSLILVLHVILRLKRRSYLTVIGV